jgi:hypothetical protein
VDLHYAVLHWPLLIMAYEFLKHVLTLDALQMICLIYIVNSRIYT